MLPKHLLIKSFIEDLQFTFSATNLFTLTRYPGIDPQGNWSGTTITNGFGNDNSAYPVSKMFTFGVKLTI